MEYQAIIKGSNIFANGRYNLNKGVRFLEFGPIDQHELSYLTNDQIERLIGAAKEGKNRHTSMCAQLCLAIGLRWSEAELIEINQIKDCLVSVIGRNRKVRRLPISEGLQKALLDHHDPAETGERIFASCYSAFRSAIDNAGIELPDGQLSHVLRHTFASAFMQNGGSILTLQRALDHRDLKTTMRYAHLAPDHLDQVLQFNPLSEWFKASTKSQRDSGSMTS